MSGNVKSRYTNQDYEHFRLLVHNAPVCIHEVDLNGKIQSMNPAGLAMMGASLDQVTGCPYLQCVEEKDRERVGYLMAMAVKGESCDFEFTFNFEGQVRIFSSCFVPIRDDLGDVIRLMGITQDLTEKRLAEQRLFEEKERAQVTLYSIGDAVISTDAAGQIDFLNPVAEQMTEWSLADAKGQLASAVFNAVDEQTGEPRPDPIAQCLLTGEMVALHEHTKLVSRSGKLYSIEDSAAPIRSRTGELTGVVLVFKDVSKARLLSRQMSYQASHDALTGLINRREFDRRLKRVLTTAEEEGTDNVLCYLDLDQFKLINDTSGHVAGDELMRQMGHLLSRSIRNRDTLARLGGDEFGLLMEHCNLEEASVIATKLIKEVASYTFSWEKHNFRVGVSVGLVSLDWQSGDIHTAMSAADSACYMAKEQGGNRVHVHHSDDADLARRQGEMQWAVAIPRALAEHRFVLYCQSIVCPQYGEGRHYEILLRMQDDDGELVQPAAFLPAAERYHLASEIDRWVVSESLHLLGQYPEHLKQLENCAINLSGASLCETDFLDFVVKAIWRNKIPPGKLCFEITETVAIANLSRAQAFIDSLKQLGCHFALDDFGSGLSSFAYLKNLPVDYLKIDGLFVCDMLEDETNYALVKSINEISHVMGKRTIAEFVETEAIMTTLYDMGVDYCQGYGISHPEPFAEFLKRSL